MPQKKLHELTEEEYNTLRDMDLLEQTFPNATGDYAEDSKTTRITTVYLHGEADEHMSDLANEMGLTGQARQNFMNCCYEVAIQVEVDTTTGDVKHIKTTF